MSKYNIGGVSFSALDLTWIAVAVGAVVILGVLLRQGFWIG
jgi:hypothetical protein